VGLAEEHRLAGLLNPLGIVRQQVREGGRRRWCYLLQAEQLADLRARYGGAADAGDEPDGKPLVHQFFRLRSGDKRCKR